MVTDHETQYTEDYYEILQLNPTADQEAIDRAYKILAKQYHPDNHETGDPEKFMQIARAYQTLADSELRAVYDHSLNTSGSNALVLLTEAADSATYEGDELLFDRILTVLYTSRRKNLRRSGLGIFQLEEMLGCPSDDLEFHVWYLREKGYAERLENGLFSITAAGVDHTIQLQKRLSRRKKKAQK
jgi:curved DNA-binding protein